MIAMRSAVWVPIYQSNPLDIIANMMIVLVSPHNEVFLCLLDAEVSDWFGPLTTYINVSKVLFGLAVLALLVSQTWQG